MQKTSITQKIALIIFGIFIALILLELGLRTGGFILTSLQERGNKAAIRKKDTYRIMCLGESTTAFGGDYSYPSQLQDILNNSNAGLAFSIINKGHPGINSLGILAKLDEKLDKYEPDMVIAMIGINDGRGALRYAELVDEKNKPIFSFLKIYKLAEIIKSHIAYKISKDIQVIDNEEASHYYGCLDPKNWPKLYSRYINRGRYYRRNGRYSEAIEMFIKAKSMDPKHHRAYHELGETYASQSRCKRAKEYFDKAIKLNPFESLPYIWLEKCNARQEMTLENEKIYSKLLYNYRKIADSIINKEIKLVAVQYPVLNVDSLKRILSDKKDVIFVDNEKIFKYAIASRSYDEYFSDMFTGDFGHCTRKGNRLLAQNIANTILKEYFDK